MLHLHVTTGTNGAKKDITRTEKGTHFLMMSSVPMMPMVSSSSSHVAPEELRHHEGAGKQDGAGVHVEEVPGLVQKSLLALAPVHAKGEIGGAGEEAEADEEGHPLPGLEVRREPHGGQGQSGAGSGADVAHVGHAEDGQEHQGDDDPGHGADRVAAGRLHAGDSASGSASSSSGALHEERGDRPECGAEEFTGRGRREEPGGHGTRPVFTPQQVRQHVRCHVSQRSGGEHGHELLHFS